MLMAQNWRGLSRAVAVVFVALVAACTNQSPPAPSPSPTSQAQSQAADLRTHLDLLLAEQVMIIAKESAGAVNHSDEYGAYAALLATNSADLTSIIARAFGNTSAVQFAQMWNSQNLYLVDYAIGVVTHNDDKANAAMTSLNGTFTPQFAQLIVGLSRLPLDPVTQLLSQQALDDRAFIDDVFAGNLNTFYLDLHRAYAQTSRFGDVLAEQIALKFPDKFPGDPSAPSVDARVKLNALLQEHSYLATMATDATVNGRGSEKGPVLSALQTNNDAIQTVVEDSRFALAWSLESASLEVYAFKNDASSRKTLTDAVVSQLGAVTNAPSDVIVNHLNAAIKVIDDQRSKSKLVADDDRAAATSMQPIADSVR